ncbi:DUF2934 domain-containing protein [Ferriphaselus sp. R-1]|uniref:DUF2934 domain-containing protein n=1 Tax=Ferriphaselus sp. R-1 TaxID=1485544 RepID=UPI00068ED177|nr:DUF2934 domain-containing protein [Ferriphaselus sp. R-1]
MTDKSSDAVIKKPRASKAKAASAETTAKPAAVAAAEAAPAKKPRAPRAKAAEAGVDKPAAKPRKAAAKKVEKQKVTHQQRREMVAMAAYFIAERRGFLTGYEHDDWLAAEREIDIHIELI